MEHERDLYCYGRPVPLALSAFRERCVARRALAQLGPVTSQSSQTLQQAAQALRTLASTAYEPDDHADAARPSAPYAS